MLSIYLKHGTNAELDGIIEGWLSKKGDDPVIDDALRGHFDNRVVYRKPTSETYKRLRELQKRLGFKEEELVAIPISGMVWARVAAVLVPTLVAVGISLYLMNNSLPTDERPLTAETIVEAPEGIQVSEQEQPNNTGIAGKGGVSAPKTPEILITESSWTDSEIYTYDLNYSAPKGSYRSITLPDHSRVLLNGGGQLAYSNNRREAHLKGEAYFVVEKNGSTPFKVRTEDMVVCVTGTEFNVEAWPGKERSLVELVKGSVNVEIKKGSMGMTPLQKLTYSKSEGIAGVAPFDGKGWWSRPLSFTDKTIAEMLNHIGECYNVRVEGRHLLESDIKYTIKFDKLSSVEEILNVLEECALRYRYEHDGATITVVMRDEME